MGAIKFEDARQYALQRLERDLSPNLLYHGIMHTRDDVVPAVETLAGQERVREDLRSLLVTAAWFHDLGFIESVSNHESIVRGWPLKSCQGLALRRKKSILLEALSWRLFCLKLQRLISNRSWQMPIWMCWVATISCSTIAICAMNWPSWGRNSATSIGMQTNCSF